MTTVRTPGKSKGIPAWEQQKVGELIGSAAIMSKPALHHVVEALKRLSGDIPSEHESDHKLKAKPKEKGEPLQSKKIHAWEDLVFQNLPEAVQLKSNNTKVFRASKEGIKALGVISSASALLGRAKAVGIEPPAFIKSWARLSRSEEDRGFQRIINSKYEGEDSLDLDALKAVLNRKTKKAVIMLDVSAVAVTPADGSSSSIADHGTPSSKKRKTGKDKAPDTGTSSPDISSN
jgi:hypothetical protein